MSNAETTTNRPNCTTHPRTPMTRCLDANGPFYCTRCKLAERRAAKEAELKAARKARAKELAEARKEAGFYPRKYKCGVLMPHPKGLLPSRCNHPATGADGLCGTHRRQRG